jgi:hypothetical protein
MLEIRDCRIEVLGFTNNLQGLISIQNKNTKIAGSRD